jgi:hypothetical protein
MRSALELALGLAGFAAALGLSLPKPPELKADGGPARSLGAAERAPLPDPREYTASYTLRARLDPEAHRVSGEGTIEFQNTSRAELRSLFLHLYLNAFKNDRTLFLRSPFGSARSALRAEEYGYVDVKRLTARELPGVDLWAGRVPHSPGDPDDETDIEVPLPKPLAPGERLTLELTFESLLPSIVERTGRAGRFHFVAQWFPKLARLEEDGRFAHFAFHPYAEFYADFGRYDVTLDVPAGFTVGASGVRQSERSGAGRREERYLAEPVHDFAWTAWDGFAERHANLEGVAVRLLYPPGHQTNAARTEAALARGFAFFAEKFGRYPYPNLTVVHPPDFAAPAGGMEYPTLITTGGPWYMPWTGVRSLEAVTIHELGHQWFYGLLASNEVDSPFLDEGLTSFAESTCLAAFLGPGSGADAFGLTISVQSAYRAISASYSEDESAGKPAPEFTSFQHLGALVYARTALLLETVARVFGRERLDRALSAYAQRFRFRHPEPEDLFAIVGEHVGAEARAVLERGLLERGRVNYRVHEILSAQNRAPQGYFERPSGRERVIAGPEPPPGYRSRVTVYRHGSLELPVDVLLIAKDGSRRMEHWDGRGTHHVFEHAGASPLIRAVIDPKQKILIDDRLFDNQSAERTSLLPRVNERLAYVMALALGGPFP